MIGPFHLKTSQNCHHFGHHLKTKRHQPSEIRTKSVVQPMSQTPYDLNNKLLVHYSSHSLYTELVVCFSSHDLNNEPFNDPTGFDHSNTKLFQNSNPTILFFAPFFQRILLDAQNCGGESALWRSLYHGLLDCTHLLLHEGALSSTSARVIPVKPKRVSLIRVCSILVDFFEGGTLGQNSNVVM